MKALDIKKKELKDAIIRELKPYIVKKIKLELDKRELQKVREFYGMNFL